MSVLLAGSALALAATAVILTWRLRPGSLLDAAIACSVIASALVVLVTGLPGIAGILRPGVLVALSFIVLLAALGWSRTALRASIARRTGRPDSEATSHLRAGVAALRRTPFASALLLLAVAAIAWQILIALVLPPFAFDAISYHLTISADWAQRGTLEPSALSLCCSRYPLTPELLFTWVLTLGGSSSMVGLVQIPFAVLGGLCTASLARSVRTDRTMADGLPMAAGSLYVLTPVVLAQSSTNYVDLILTAWVLAALHGLVRFTTTGRWVHLVTVCIAAGLTLGTKGVGVLWGVTLLVAGVVLVARADVGRDVNKTARGAAFIAGIAVLGGYWYVRNWIEVSNPMAPFRVDVAGRTLFDGPIDLEATTIPAPSGSRFGPLGEVASSWSADLRLWQIGGYDYQQRAGGLGPVWAWLGVPCLIALVVHTFRRRGPLMIPMVLISVVFAVQPFRWWSRFTLAFAAIGAIAIVYVLGVLRGRVRLVAQGVVVALAVTGVGLVVRQVEPASRAEPLAAGELLSLIGRPDSERSLQRVFFAEYEFLDVLPAEATVYVDLQAPPLRFVFPIFGRDLGRSVHAIGETDVAPDPGSWVVTAAGSPIETTLERSGDFVVRSNGDIRVWGPLD